MEKFTSLLKLTAYIFAYILCECILHYLQVTLVIGSIASITLKFMEIISGIGAAIEIIELITGIEVKEKIKELSDQLWTKIKRNYFVQ
jgi:hypothetical protein